MANRPGRLSGKAAKRKSAWRKPRNQVIAAVAVLALVGGGVGLSIALDDSSGDAAAVARTPGDEWKDGIVTDFTRMSQGTLDYLRVINDWRDGKAKGTEVDLAAGQALDKFVEARELLKTRAAFEPAPRALDNYRDAVEIYIAHARLAMLASVEKDENLRTQTQLTMARLRYLGDRAYDLGGREMEPHVFQDAEVEGFEYQPPVEVPSFGAGDLRPGPPLAQAKPVSGAERTYQEVRPEVEFATWLTTVEGAKIPSAEAEAKTIRDGSTGELGTLADELTAASDKLYAAADPRDERLINTRIQLGLLIQAEAMRAAQIAQLVPAADRKEATEVAQSLALVGNRMWDSRLGARDVGFPATLLTVRPAVAPPPIEDGTVPPTPAPTASTPPAAQ